MGCEVLEAGAPRRRPANSVALVFAWVTPFLELARSCSSQYCGYFQKCEISVNQGVFSKNISPLTQQSGTQITDLEQICG